MKKLLLSLSLLSILTACSTKDTMPTVSPYPSIPMSIGVSGEAQVPTPSTDTPTGSSYTARGTEPFWIVDVIPSMSTLTRPAETTNIAVEYDTEESDKGGIVSIKSPKGDFFLTLTKGECSDGMSETKYSYNATLNVGAKELKGCANKK